MLDRSELLERFRWAQDQLGLETPFVVHSLRHGGATHDHSHGCLTIEEIMLRGRWSGLRVTKRYIQDAQALLMMGRVPSAVRHRVEGNLKSMHALLKSMNVVLENM